MSMNNNLEILKPLIKPFISYLINRWNYLWKSYGKIKETKKDICEITGLVESKIKHSVEIEEIICSLEPENINRTGEDCSTPKFKEDIVNKIDTINNFMNSDRPDSITSISCELDRIKACIKDHLKCCVGEAMYKEVSYKCPSRSNLSSFESYFKNISITTLQDLEKRHSDDNHDYKLKDAIRRLDKKLKDLKVSLEKTKEMLDKEVSPKTYITTFIFFFTVLIIIVSVCINLLFNG